MRWTLVTLALLAFILVPYLAFEDQFNALADRIVRHDMPASSLFAAVSALLASDVFLPVPSSIVAAGAGLLLGFWRGALSIWTGMTAACLLGYGFGRWSAAAARRFVGDAGMARAGALSMRYGDSALVLCRPVPVLAEASVIAAGIVRRPFARFLMVTTWSNLGVAMGYAAIGAFSMRVDSFLLAFAGSLVVPAVAILLSRLWLRVAAGDGRRGAAES